MLSNNALNTECIKTVKLNIPCMGTYPLVNYGNSSIFKEFEVLCGWLKAHHVWQQLFQLLYFCKFYRLTSIIKSYKYTIY